MERLSLKGKPIGLSRTGGWILVGSSIGLRIRVCECGKLHQLALLKSTGWSRTDSSLLHICSATDLEEAVRFADHTQSQHETVG